VVEAGEVAIVKDVFEVEKVFHAEELIGRVLDGDLEAGGVFPQVLIDRLY
jgi:hypothetical protein